MAEIRKYLDTTALGTLVDQIKAEDAKALAAAKKYTDDAGKLYDGAGSAATAEENAKAYTDTLANGAVKTNTENIAKLNGDAATEGSVAKAVADAKALVDADVDAVEAIANKNKEDIAAINDGTNGILAQAKGYVDGQISEVEGDLADLAELVGTLPEGTTAKDVVDYVNIKTAGIATDAALEELQGQLNAVQGTVNTINGDHLKGSDKTELEGKIGTAQAAAEGAQSYAEGVAGDLAEAVEALEGADAGQVARIEALEGTITGLSGAMHFKGVVESDPTKITSGYEQGDVVIYGNKEYVWNNGAFVEFGDASVNAGAITVLDGRVSTAEGKITTAEGKIAAVEGAVATKVEQSAYDAKVAELAGVDTALGNRITTLEGKFGGADGSVEDMIADAKTEAITEAGTNADTKDEAVLAAAKKYADEEDANIESRVDALEAASATHALASDLTALAGRVTTAEGEIDTLQSEMDAVEAKALANEGAIGTINTELTKKAAQSDLDAAVARIAKNETDIAAKASDADLDDAVERIVKNEADIAENVAAIAANTSAINSFTAITSDEVNALFA